MIHAYLARSMYYVCTLEFAANESYALLGMCQRGGNNIYVLLPLLTMRAQHVQIVHAIPNVKKRAVQMRTIGGVFSDFVCLFDMNDK